MELGKISIAFFVLVMVLCTFATGMELPSNKKPTIERSKNRVERDSVNPKCYDKCVKRFGIKSAYYCFYSNCYSAATTSTATPTPAYWGYYGWEFPNYYGGKSWNGGKSWGGGGQKSWGGGGQKSWGGGGQKSWGGGKSWDGQWGKKKK